MLTEDEIWVFSLIAVLILLVPFFLRKINSDYKTAFELSRKSVIYNLIFFGLFTMTILNAALYTRWTFVPDNFPCRVTGYVLILVAVIIIAEAFFEFRSLKRVSGLQADRVIASGVYRLTRNPQYLALFLFLIGFSLYHRSVIAFILIPIFFLLVNTFIITGEEKYLEKSLGNNYIEYKKRVRRWV